MTTERGRYVLTLYERLPADELPFYLNLMAHLAKAGVAVPAPAPDRTGALFSMLCGKPASLVDRIDGVAHLAPHRSRLRGDRRVARRTAPRGAELPRRGSPTVAGRRGGARPRARCARS